MCGSKSYFSPQTIGYFSPKQEYKSIQSFIVSNTMFLKTEMKYKHMSTGPFHEHWDDAQLTTQHIQYAADDALVGYESFIQLMNIIQKNNANVIHSTTEHLLNSYLVICEGCIDIKAIKTQKQKPTKIISDKPRVKKRNKIVPKQFIKPQFFDRDDIYTLHNCKQLELKYNNLIQFHLSP
eukprot:961572_1